MNNLPFAGRRSRRPWLSLLSGLTLAALLPVLAADGKAAMLAAQKALAAQDNYRYTIVTTGVDKKVNTTVFERIRPDRFHTQRGALEFTIIGAQAWQRGPNGKWMKSAMDTSQYLAAMQGPASSESLKGIQVTTAGTDTLDGRATNVYLETYNTSGVTGTSRIWVSAADNLPRKAVSTFHSTANPTGGATTMTGTYEYNVPGLSINPPM